MPLNDGVLVIVIYCLLFLPENVITSFSKKTAEYSLFIIHSCFRRYKSINQSSLYSSIVVLQLGLQYIRKQRVFDCLEFITTDCKFLILGNIQAYYWLFGFLQLSVIQLVS